MLFGNEEALPFWIADIDMEVMPGLVETLQKVATSGVFGYETRQDGLTKSLSGWFGRRHDMALKEQMFLFTPSVLTSLSVIIESFTAKGEGIVIQPPVYQAFAQTIQGLNRRVVNNPLRFEDGQYRMDLEDLVSRITREHPKIMLLCSPHNPVGRVWTKQELLAIAHICIEHDVMMVSDEIHADIVFPEHQFIGMSRIFDELSTHFIMIGSSGKSFGIPGIVDSFIYTPERMLYKKLKFYIESHHLHKCNAFTNAAVTYVYDEGDEWMDQFIHYLFENISLVQQFCNTELPALNLIRAEGTYQVWLDFRGLKVDEPLLVKLLSQNAGVALNSGSSYGEEGTGFMRMNIGVTHDMLLDGLGRMKQALSKTKAAI